MLKRIFGMFETMLMKVLLLFKDPIAEFEKAIEKKKELYKKSYESLINAKAQTRKLEDEIKRIESNCNDMEKQLEQKIIGEEVVKNFVKQLIVLKEHSAVLVDTKQKTDNSINTAEKGLTKMISDIEIMKSKLSLYKLQNDVNSARKAIYGGIEKIEVEEIENDLKDNLKLDEYKIDASIELGESTGLMKSVNTTAKEKELLEKYGYNI
jgi:hypothetical protein